MGQHLAEKGRRQEPTFAEKSQEGVVRIQLLEKFVGFFHTSEVVNHFHSFLIQLHIKTDLTKYF